MKRREGIVTGRFLQLAWFTWFYFSLLLLLINLFFARVASQNLWICLCCSFCCISIWTCSFRGDRPAKPKPQTPLLQLKVNELQISFPYLNPILRQTPVFDWLHLCAYKTLRTITTLHTGLDTLSKPQGHLDATIAWTISSHICWTYSATQYPLLTRLQIVNILFIDPTFLYLISLK